MLEDIRLAFQGIWNHKLRSALTMLGIIIGIGSIIAIVSTIKGTNEQIKKNLVGAGNDAVNVQLYQGDWPIDLQYQSLPDGVPEISDETLQEVVELPEVETASLYHTRNEYDAVYRGAKSLSNSVILGIDRNYLDVYGYQVTKGRGLTDKDYSEGRKVALIDKTTAASLFDNADVIGRTIEIKGEPFVVVGMVAKKAESQPVINSMEDYYRYMSDDQSGKIIIPDQVWPVIYQYDEPQNLVVRAKSTDDMTAAGEKTADILNAMLTVSDDTVKYKGEDLLEQATQIQEISNSTNQQLIWIAQHFPVSWWNRSYEYHARVGYRTYRRDWIKEGTRSEKAQNSDTVPDRGSGTDTAWRNYRCSWRNRACVHYIQSLSSSGSNQRSFDCDRSAVLHTDRYYLRIDPVRESGEHESNRST